MATNTQIKASIDANITSKTLPGSINNTLVGSDIKSVVDYVDQEISTIPTGVQGPIGPQGVTGNDGDAGPIGPAGLTWQGTWVSGTSYIADDAVGFGGASYFCILVTSGIISPDLDTTHWALLASQGAQGVPGFQGPMGPQGPAGVVSTKTLGIIEPNIITPSVLTYDINEVYSAGTYRLPELTNLDLGKVIKVRATTNNLVIKTFDQSTKISINNVNGYSSSTTLQYNQECDFMYLGSGYWKSIISLGSFLKINNALLSNTNEFYLSVVNTVSTTALDLNYLNSFYNTNLFPNGFRIICTNITGGPIVYTKIGNGVWGFQSMSLVS
jgi:hypothetical protein